MKYFVLLLSLITLMSCQMKPTKVTDQDAVVLKEGQRIQDLMKEQPVILDARSTFEFNLNHVPGSVNVRWEDFSQQDHNSRGLLEPDLFALARRLSLIGVDLDRPVLVLGQGSLGQAEEGRVAWTLKVLGVKRVYTANIKSLRSQAPREEPLIQNKPYWLPQVDESLWIDMKTFKDLVRNKHVPRALPSRARKSVLGVAAQPLPEKKILGADFREVYSKAVVLDVRGAQEFYIENLTQKKNVSVSVSQVDWKDFFNALGAPDAGVLAKLQEKGISKENYIFVISKHGVRSGAVVYALRQLGFTNVTNVAGGYEQWNLVK